MKRHRYKFSSEHLDFVKVPRTIRKLMRRIAFYVLGFALLTIGYYIIYSSFFDTPIERGLRRENEMLSNARDSFNAKFEKVEVVIGDLKERDKKIYQTIYQTDPLESSEFAYSSVARYEELSKEGNTNLVKETKVKLHGMMQQAYVQSQMLGRLLQKMEEQGDSLLYIPAIQPIYNPSLEKTGASVGMRIHPFYKILKMHNGIDFVAASGTKVFATASGAVEKVLNSPRDQGLHIVINHGNGYETVYAHLEEALVKIGQEVKRGDLIGKVGSSGASSMSPHLHYEVLKNEQVVDPVNYFFMDMSPTDYLKMIHLASNNGQSLD